MLAVGREEQLKRHLMVMLTVNYESGAFCYYRIGRCDLCEFCLRAGLKAALQHCLIVKNDEQNRERYLRKRGAVFSAAKDCPTRSRKLRRDVSLSRILVPPESLDGLRQKNNRALQDSSGTSLARSRNRPRSLPRRRLQQPGRHRMLCWNQAARGVYLLEDFTATALYDAARRQLS